MRLFRFLLLTMLFTIPPPEEGLAQDEAIERYDKGVIRLEMNWWRTQFIVNDKPYKTGFMYRNLASVLGRSPRTHEDLSKFRKRQKFSYAFYTLSLGLSLAAWLTHQQDKDDDTRAYVIGDIAAMTISRLFSWAARNSLDKAIWLYNRDVVAGTVASVGVRDRNTAVLSFRLAL